jgi:hypothetical protein
MPVAVVLDFEGGTLEQYDRISELMGHEPGGEVPEGALFHWVTETPTGIRVTDVWETREQFEQFAAEQIGPHSQQVGIPNPPQIAYHDVHNHLSAS